ncbi:MAG TPA: hypothetical protein VJS69_13365 [Candidatus Krumholzibacteria bacterium]|nr:hypothetical protein [Candidatus Krumholzibacteria bacterium]
MRRLALFTLLISVLVLSAQSVLACGGNCGFNWNARPTTGMAPLSIFVGGETEGSGSEVRIDMGGEQLLEPAVEIYFDGSPCYGEGFHAVHQFYCPGTYTITVVDPAAPDWEPTTTTVTVLPPPRYSLSVFAENHEHEAYLATQLSTTQRQFSYSSVDWGDGTSEPFTYVPRGIYVGTPTHLYPADGEYTATVTHHYVGQYCSWEQTEAIVVKIPVPTVATNPSTWGHVKSMYR